MLLSSSAARADQPPSTPEGPPCRREDVGKPCNSRGSLCREKERRQGRKLVKVYRCDFDWSFGAAAEPENEAPKKRLFGCAMTADPTAPGAPSGSLLPMLLILFLFRRTRPLLRLPESPLRT